jgi:hypothetical protein
MGIADNARRDGEEGLIGDEDSEERISLGRISHARLSSSNDEAPIPPPARSSTRAAWRAPRETRRSGLRFPESFDAKRTLPFVRVPPSLPRALPPVRPPAPRKASGPPPSARPVRVPPPLPRRPAATTFGGSPADVEPPTNPSPRTQEPVSQVRDGAAAGEPRIDTVPSTRSTDARRWIWSIAVVMLCAGLGTWRLLAQEAGVMQARFDGALRAMGGELTPIPQPKVEAPSPAAAVAAVASQAPTAAAPPKVTAPKRPDVRAKETSKEPAEPPAPAAEPSAPAPSSGRFEPEGL